MNDVNGRVEVRPRRIIPALAIAFSAGLLISALSVLPVVPLITAGLLFATAALSLKHRGSASVCLHVSVMVTGMLWMTLEDQSRRSDYISHALPRDRSSAVVTGVIMGMPDQMITDSTGRTNWSFMLKLERFGSGNHSHPVTGTIRILLPAQPGITPGYGERWSISGAIRKDNRPLYWSRGVAGTMYADASRSRIVEARQGHRFIAWCYEMRMHAYDRLGWGMSDDAASVSVSRALLLGYRQDIDRTVYDAFARTGTLHILALSGMHVGILVMLLVIVLKASGVSRQYWVLWITPILLVYTVATGAASSMVRATIMGVIYFSAMLVRRKPDVVTALSLAALLILLAAPLELFSPGFILSFVAVGGLVTIYPRIMKRWTKADQDAAVEPETGWLHASYRIRTMFISTAAISLSAWLVTLPLIVLISHLISPVALLVNLVMGPLSFVLLLTECLSMLSSALSVQAAITFNHANDVFAQWLLALIDISSKWPAAYFYVAAWSLAAVTMWYLLLLVALSTHRWPGRLAWAGLLFMVVVSVGQRSWSNNVHAAVLSCGDANVLLIDGPGNHAVLIDSGSAYQNRNLLDALRSRGINRIDQLWISRATTDAYGGVAGLLDRMAVDSIVTPVTGSRQQGFQRTIEQWRSHRSGPRISSWPESDQVELPGGIVMRIMHPIDREGYRDARSSSLVLHISHGHQSVIFAGRIEHETEQQYLQSSVDWSSQGLVVGTCSDPMAFSGPWLSLVNPTDVYFNPRHFDRQAEGPGPVLDRLEGRFHKSDQDHRAEVAVWSL